ncbi:hypothetical protein OCU04_006998 [Sclerotinia nivalis]|uniref:BTB domain-containing protein n=1 Tax=Sclerotinia nivalis TaxID=352851 RepID=A0A9X0AKX1_9HELO|nr:hypothetical protein OCU04_006998 [Sclerotinia nivalis]
MTVRLIDVETTIDPDTEKESKVVTVLATYRVCRKVLTDNSPVFNACLRIWTMESKQTVLDIQDGTVKSWELWFRILHDRMVPEMHEVEVKEIYEAIEICGYRRMDIQRLVDWSPKWFLNQKIDKISLNDMRSLLYVAKELDRIKEFHFMTRKLAYGMSHHVQEENPSRHRHLHLPHAVMGALNAARGSLHSKLLKGVFDPIDWFLDQKCSCRADSHFAYSSGLRKIGIWPIESCNKKSVQEILDSFDKFVCEIPKNACMECKSHLSSTTIAHIRNSVQSHFGGLCLDCMENSGEESEARFVYYRNDVKKAWDSVCRISHGQSSWYWSNMGKKEVMQAHQERKKRAYENRQRFGF